MGKQLTAFTVVLTIACAVPALGQTRVRLVSMSRTPSLTGEVPREQRGDREQRDHQTERFTKTVRIGANGQIDVANIAGDITVTRGRGNDVTIDVVKTARGRTPEDAQEALRLVEVEIAERAGRAEVRTRYPSSDEMRGRNRRGLNVSVAYTIAAPADATVTVESVSGNIGVRDIGGELNLKTVSGNITVAGDGRVATAKSISGNVELTGLHLDGALDAGSVSGNVIVRQIKAQKLDLGTVSGNVTAVDIDCGRVGLQSMSGSVDYSGRLMRGGRYQIKSHSGDVRLAVDDDTGFTIDASTFSGSVHSDLPVTMRGDGARRSRAVRGVHGDGSASIEAVTFSGNIRIVKR